ncbi:MAG: Ubiquinone biosynthesis O-methyltransferase [Anaerolineae bacterium]|nr:Ubiquinone biosynthesis O-methyltransferase [Anaerolineae bacterium]
MELIWRDGLGSQSGGSKVLTNLIPTDYSHQESHTAYLDRIFQNNSNNCRVMDFGCGTGEFYNYFRQKGNISWVGLDIEHSPEVNGRVHHDFNFVTYNGLQFPFPNDYFDLIYTFQVFEHVRHPESVLQELFRTLKPGGHFAGSTSYLEPYHSLSYWNYTPFGFVELLNSVGFCVIELRPSIDAFTLIIRNALRAPASFDRWWGTDSPLNSIISTLGTILRKSPQSINAMKLQFSGQFLFLAIKPKT